MDGSFVLNFFMVYTPVVGGGLQNLTPSDTLLPSNFLLIG